MPRVKVEIKAISAQPTEVGVGLSWAELGNRISKFTHNIFKHISGQKKTFELWPIKKCYAQKWPSMTVNDTFLWMVSGPFKDNKKRHFIYLFVIH